MWPMYLPLNKTELKFLSLWQGPYTVIDKTSDVNYKIQLVGTYIKL